MKSDELTPFFDEDGRCIPIQNLRFPVNPKDITKRYQLVQPELNYNKIHARITNHLRIGQIISVDEFTDRANIILNNLQKEDDIKLVTNGIYVPFYLAKSEIGDYGKTMEEIFLPAVETSFKERFPKYDFYNHRKGQLAYQVNIANGTRHEKLLEAIKNNTVVGFYFPNCFLGFSVNAAIEQISTLPDLFLLAGGLDTIASIIGSPDILMKTDAYPSLLDLAALQWHEKQKYSFQFEAYGYNLTFNGRYHNSKSSDYCASGLVVIG